MKSQLKNAKNVLQHNDASKNRMNKLTYLKYYYSLVSCMTTSNYRCQVSTSTTKIKRDVFHFIKVPTLNIKELSQLH